MSNNKHLPLGGEGYQRILKVSPLDARLYLWSERVVMIASVGAVAALLVMLIFQLGDAWPGITRYLLGVVLLPLPFVILLLAAAWLHRRVGRRHGL